MRNNFAGRAIASSAFVGALGVLPTPVRASPSASDAAPPPVVTDPGARARAQYEAGTEAFSGARFVEAALDFEAAAAAKPSPIALYTASMSWERANAPERAADDYARALGIGGLTPETAGAAEQRLATLEAVLGRAVVTAPAGWRVQLDGGTEAVVPATLHGAAGIHLLTVHSSAGTVTRLSVVLQSGVATRVDLPERAATPSATSARPPAERTGGTGAEARRTAGWVVIGAAGAALLSAVLLGVEALDARSAYNADPAAATSNHALSLQRWTNIAWVTGGALLVGGLVLVVWPAPRPVAAAAIGPGYLLLRGDF
jgi:hypothetical protein